MVQTGFRRTSGDLATTDLDSVHLVGRPAVDLLRTDSALCR